MAVAPAVFVSHGAPTIAIEDDAYTRALEAYGRSLQPAAVVVVSAHWEERGNPRATAGERPRVIHDFGGFSEALYSLDYPVPGSPALVEEIGRLLKARRLDLVPDTRRGFDHGVWVPLRRLLPEARVPVVALSLPFPREPADVLAMGRALAPLRDEGVLLLGSGGIVHNLRRLEWGEKNAAPKEWALGFDRWVAHALEVGDLPDLLEYRAMAPDAELAAPTPEHFDPLFFVLGARHEADRLVTFYQGFHYGTLSLRSFSLERGTAQGHPTLRGV